MVLSWFAGAQVNAPPSFDEHIAVFIAVADEVPISAIAATAAMAAMLNVFTGRIFDTPFSGANAPSFVDKTTREYLCK